MFSRGKQGKALRDKPEGRWFKSSLRNHKGVGQETCSFFVCGARRVTVKDFLQSITDSRVA